MNTSFGYAVLLVWTSTAALLAASAPPRVSLPANDVVLQIALAVPARAQLDPSKRWVLSDPNELTEPILVELVSGRDAEGSLAKAGQILLASIPPQKRPSGLRQFNVLESQTAASGSKTESAFRFEKVNEKSLGLWEGKRPVFVYNFGVISKPGIPADRNRSTYLHPIYGLDGEVLTDDFPEDHYHHRGLFWAWPHVRVGSDQTNYDLWDIRGIHQRFERWLDQHAGKVAAVLGVENGWYIGEKKVAQERVWLTLYPASAQGQALDVDLTWIPVDQPITLAGAEGKSYGGLTLRFAPRTGTVITTPLGNKAEDLAMTRLPWADFSAQFAGAPAASGASIFIAPTHRDYPPTWLTRHYGALCVGWPGVTPASFPPGQPIHCQYRLWIHRGIPSGTRLEGTYHAYASAQAAHWQH